MKKTSEEYNNDIDIIKQEIKKNQEIIVFNKSSISIWDEKVIFLKNKINNCKIINTKIKKEIDEEIINKSLNLEKEDWLSINTPSIFYEKLISKFLENI